MELLPNWLDAKRVPIENGSGTEEIPKTGKNRRSSGKSRIQERGMKKFRKWALTATVLLVLSLMGCQPADTSTPPKTFILNVAYAKTLAGYTLTATETTKLVKALNARSIGTITFAPSSIDSSRVTTNVSTLAGKVAYLNPTSGNITPLGSSSTTITVIATDTNSGTSGSIDVPISTIDFASAAGKIWNLTGSPASTAKSDWAGASGMSIKFIILANEASPPSSALPSSDQTASSAPVSIDLTGTSLACVVPVLNQNNAGYINSSVNGTVTGSPCLWFALDNKIYLDLPAYSQVDATTDYRGGYLYKVPVLLSNGLYDVNYIYPCSLSSGTQFVIGLWDYNASCAASGVSNGPAVADLTTKVNTPLTFTAP